MRASEDRIPPPDRVDRLPRAKAWAGGLAGACAVLVASAAGVCRGSCPSCGACLALAPALAASLVVLSARRVR